MAGGTAGDRWRPKHTSTAYTACTACTATGTQGQATQTLAGGPGGPGPETRAGRITDPATVSASDLICRGGLVWDGVRQPNRQTQAQGPGGRSMGGPKQEDGRQRHQVDHKAGGHGSGQRTAGTRQRKDPRGQRTEPVREESSTG